MNLVSMLEGLLGRPALGSRPQANSPRRKKQSNASLGLHVHVSVGRSHSRNELIFLPSGLVEVSEQPWEVRRKDVDVKMNVV